MQLRDYAIVAVVSAAALWGLAEAMRSVRDDPKTREREKIAYCWKDQERKSHEPATARFIAGACEKMEADFKQKYGVSP